MSLNRADDMKKVFRLPMLPGNSYGEELLRKNFRKAQILSRGERGMASEVPIDFDALQVAQSVKGASTNTSLVGAEDPTLTLDRKVLRFYAYFKEGVHESAHERERVRRCTIFYHLEDDTVSVSETRTDNSGMPQGSLIKRHQIAGITFDQFNIGFDVRVYGKVFHITDCDSFTRSFLSGVGITVPEAEPEARDEYTSKREAAAKRAPKPPNVEFQKAKMTKQEVKSTTQFLQNDRKVLKFKAVWDDTASLNGTKRYFNIYYFLADDTIEVIEENDTNSGRDPFPSFVRRQKCPKVDGPKFENPTASLTFSNRKEHVDSYTDADLRIGATLTLFGRKFFLYSCDAATEQHLRTKYGLGEFTPIDVRPPEPERVKREPPPHNGFGDEDDALGSWKNLVLKPPKRDMQKYMDNVGNTLKFELKLDTKDPCDEIRRFVLTYYLADDTLSIFEPAVRNSGITSGKFLQRGKIRNPNTGEFYRANEFYVGGQITINNHVFNVRSCDEKSMSFMEQSSKDYPLCDINNIMCKVRAMLTANGTGLREAFSAADDSGTAIEFEALNDIFTNLNLPITQHETLTIVRYLDRNGDSGITYADLVGRLSIDESKTTSSDDWQSLYDAERGLMNGEISTLNRTVQRKEVVKSTKAAYTAKDFLDRYSQRKQLFNTTLQQICDYSPDGKIGPEQFRVVCNDKLQLGYNEDQLEAICSKLFPPSLRRATYAEFVKLLNGTSCHEHNVNKIIKRST